MSCFSLVKFIQQRLKTPVYPPKQTNPTFWLEGECSKPFEKINNIYIYNIALLDIHVVNINIVIRYYLKSLIDQCTFKWRRMHGQVVQTGQKFYRQIDHRLESLPWHTVWSVEAKNIALATNIIDWSFHGHCEKCIYIVIIQFRFRRSQINCMAFFF